MNEYVSFGRIKRNDKVILNFKKVSKLLLTETDCSNAYCKFDTSNTLEIIVLGLKIKRLP